MFKKYQHIENSLDSIECRGLTLLNPEEHLVIQPKLDGSNCSVWLEDGKIQVASRNRQLSLSGDNAQAYAVLHNNENVLEFFKFNPNCRLYGEWLVKHHVDYKEDAYKKFYVYDIEDDTGNYIPYPKAFEKGTMHGLYMVPFGRVHDVSKLDSIFTDEEMSGVVNYLVNTENPEGIVIKNYFYRNPFNRSIWCKILHPNFSNHRPKSGAKSPKKHTEETTEFVDLFMSESLIAKTIAKLNVVNETNPKNQIGQIIQLVKYDLIKEYLADYVINKKCVIDFNQIGQHVAAKVVKYVKETGACSIYMKHINKAIIRTLDGH